MTNMDDTEPPPLVAAKRSSWWRRNEILNRLDPDVFDVVFCPHPRYAPGHRATLEEYVGADVVIADGGSTIWEAMILGLPVVFPSWITREGFDGVRTLEAEMYHRGVGVHVDRPEHLAGSVEAAAERGQSGAEALEGALSLPEEFRGVSGERHAEWLEQLLHRIRA